MPYNLLQSSVRVTGLGGEGNWEVEGKDGFGKLKEGDLVMHKQKIRFRHSPKIGYFGAAWLNVTEIC